MSAEEIMVSDEVFMTRALELAQQAFACGEVPVGAVVVLDDKVIGEAFNQPIGRADPSAHAEVLALRRAAAHLQNYRIPGAKLYVTIEPCTMCLGTIVHARVAELIYGAAEPKSGMLASYPELLASGRYNHKLRWRGGVMEAQCTDLIQEFFKQRRVAKKQSKVGSKDQ